MNIPISFKMKCSNVMGMPTDTVTCNLCGESKTVWGDSTLRKMEDWATNHKCLIVISDV